MGKTRLTSNFARLDVLHGRRAIARRLDRGERVTVQVTMVLDPDPAARSDDGVSIEFGADVTAVREIEEGRTNG